MNVPKEHRCPHCGAKMAWTGKYWLIADRHGKLDKTETLAEPISSEPELRTCLQCGRPLQLGAARVEEVVE